MDADQRDRILAIIASQPDMTVATLREDGFPQATVVSYVNDGMSLYFGCGARSQKARNMTRDPRVSVTITPPYDDWSGITGVSLGGRARRLADPAEVERAGAMMFEKFPQARTIAGEGPPPDMALFRIDPVAISLLDYSKGFGHCELILATEGGTLR